MIRKFDVSCEGCPNYERLNEFADKAQVLEVAVTHETDFDVVRQGIVLCQGSADGQRMCRATEPKLPEIELRKEVVGFVLSLVAKIKGPDPELVLVGRPTDGALYVGHLLVTKT